MARNKIGNYENLQTLSNNTIYNSGIYYGKVVSIDDPLNEGRIKVNVYVFDRFSKTFCKDVVSNTLQENNVKLMRKQGVIEESTSVGNVILNPIFTPIADAGITPIINQSQVDSLLKKAGDTGTKEITDDGCISVPWAVPLLPKHLQVMPKEGEMCMILVENTKQPQKNRYWIGPMLSNKSKLSYQQNVNGGDLFNTAVIPEISENKTKNRTEDGDDLDKKGDFTGGFPEKLDVAIMGRNNADIVMPTDRDGQDRLNRGGEVLIRAGKFKFTTFTKNELSLNTTNPGFLRIKVVKEGTGIDASNFKTHSMLYSDYISLVSYKNSDGSAGIPSVFKINPLLEKDKQLGNFHEALSPLIRGDKLIEFLKLLINYVKNHNHPYHKLPPTDANSKTELEKFPLASLISPHIRIN